MLRITMMLLVMASMASAQTSTTLRLGVFGSYGGAQTDQQIPTIPDCDCPQFSELAGTYVNGGLVLQLPFTTGEGINVGMLMQFGYHGATLEEKRPGDKIPSLDQDGNVVYATTEFRADVTDRLILLDLAADLSLSGVTLDLGASVGYRSYVKGRTTISLIDPPDAEFDPFILPYDAILVDSVTMEIMSWDDETTEALVIGPYASLGYRFVLDVLTFDVAAETRLLWPAAIPDATRPMWTYGGNLRVMYTL